MGLEEISFDYEVLYRKMTSNEAADAISRRPLEEFNVITIFHTDLLDKIRHSWITNPYLVQLISQL